MHFTTLRPLARLRLLILQFMATFCEVRRELHVSILWCSVQQQKNLHFVPTLDRAAVLVDLTCATILAERPPGGSVGWSVRELTRA